MSMLRVGIAMLQGARHEHAEAVVNAAHQLELNVEIVPLRTPHDLMDGIDALILPGGESTTMRITSRHYALLDEIFTYIHEHPHIPVLGTCAGAILLAAPPEPHTRCIDVELTRNTWGRQRESFEAVIDVNLDIESFEFEGSYRPVKIGSYTPLMMEQQAAPTLNEGFPGVFIRAPRFCEISEPCRSIAMLENEVVGVQQNNIVALTFHPELTKDRRFHRWLLTQANVGGQ